MISLIVLFDILIISLVRYFLEIDLIDWFSSNLSFSLIIIDCHKGSYYCNPNLLSIISFAFGASFYTC